MEATLIQLLADPMAHVRPAKVLRAVQLVEQNARKGRKTLVWSSFVANVRALAEALATFEPAVVVGSTPVRDPAAPTDRARELLRFRSDPACRVLIATPQTLGEGVSLHRVCYDQVHVDRGFAAATFLQSLDRTHRLGMPADSRPTCTVLIARDTIDERVEEVLARKVLALSRAMRDRALQPLALPEEDVAADTTPFLLDDLKPDRMRSLLAVSRRT